MIEKDTDSMAAVQMKTDYAASDVFSTASEAPPAYKRQSNSVKIAKIVAFTTVACSFILGSFILASAYLQAKASCDQVQALDSVLEKELMLETLQQVNKELPRAEALLGKVNTGESDLQNIDQEELNKNNENNQLKKLRKPDSEISENDNSYSDSNEDEEAPSKWHSKVPLKLDLSDLAAALLKNNKRSKMNCVVERKRAEEIVDTPSKTVALPFGMNLTTDPKKARITGEQISIYCEGDKENKDQDQFNKQQREEEDDTEEDAEPISAMFIPYHSLRPFGRIPQEFPLTHMPQTLMQPVMQTPQQHIIHQMSPPFQRIPIHSAMPPRIMEAPNAQKTQATYRMPQQPQTVRIHVQHIPFREIQVAEDVPVQSPVEQQELPQLQIQRMPLSLALQRAGITADDLRNIQFMAEKRIAQELSRLADDEVGSNDSNSSEGEEDDSSTNRQSFIQISSIKRENKQQTPQELSQQQKLPIQSQQIRDKEEQKHPEARFPIQRLILQPLPEQPRDTIAPPMPPIKYERIAYGRSLAQPVRIPVPMMPKVPNNAAGDSFNASPIALVESERPHFVQPRSV